MEIKGKNLHLTWKFMLGDMHSEKIPLLPSEMEHFNQTGDDEHRIEIWKGHPDCGKDFQVRVEWNKIKNSLYSGHISFSGYQGNLFVEEIYFPILIVPHLAEQRMIFGGWDIGMDFEIPKKKTPGIQGVIDFQITSMQFSALTAPECSYYVDHRDPSHSVKFMKTILTDEGQVECSPIYLIGNRDLPFADFSLPYNCTAGSFSGGWFDACQIYKEWALEQPWVQNLKNRKNPLRPIGMWIWNRGNSEEVIPPVLKLQQDLGKVTVALDWYWWHHNPYDTEVPDLWPPREGVEKFCDSIRRLKENGVFTQVYTAAAGWDIDYPGWKPEYERELVYDRGGVPRTRVANIYMGNRCGRVCGEASVFHDKMSELTRHIHDSGLDSIYLDVLGCATYAPCYNPAHRHTWGGGSYQVEGYRKLLKRLHSENPGFPMTTENCNEAYMDMVDGSIVIQVSNDRIGSWIGGVSPLFTAVYHGLTALFGNYSMPDGIPPWDELWPQHPRWKKEELWHRLYPDQFYFELSRPMIWGLQPMVCNLRWNLVTDPEFAEMYRFILDTANFYHSNLKFLFDGKMLSPDGFHCNVHRVDFMSRVVYTRLENFKINRVNHPAVLHCLWEAPDGEKALFMANYTAKEQSWEYKKLSGTIKPHSYLKVSL